VNPQPLPQWDLGSPAVALPHPVLLPQDRPPLQDRPLLPLLHRVPPLPQQEPLQPPPPA
jgi:hypothetical protein